MVFVLFLAGAFFAPPFLLPAAFGFGVALVFFAPDFFADDDRLVFLVFLSFAGVPALAGEDAAGCVATAVAAGVSTGGVATTFGFLVALVTLALGLLAVLALDWEALCVYDKIEIYWISCLFLGHIEFIIVLI